MQTKKSQPEGKQIMLETRFTEFPALSVDQRVGISQSVTGDRCLIMFLIYDIKNYYMSLVTSFIFDILRRTTTFSDRHSAFFVVMQK